MRGEVSDCDDFPGQLELYRANTERALKGKKGQKFLRELEAALLALPEKKLIAHDFVRGGAVCALGALGVRRAICQGCSRDEALQKVSEILNYDAEVAAEELGICFNLAWEVMYLNDDRDGQDRGRTPEQRYEQMLSWIRENLRP